MQRISLTELQSVQLRTPAEPTVVRNSFFFVKDTTPDPKPAWVIPNRLAVGSQDCAFADETKMTFTHVVNVGYDIPNAFEKEGLTYKKVNACDLEDFSLINIFDELHTFIDSAIGHAGPQSKAAVLIHCQAGVSRSVTVAISYLMLCQARRGTAPSYLECFRAVQQVRASAAPNLGFIAQLHNWERILQEKFSFPFNHEDSVKERNLRLIREANSCSDLKVARSPPLKVQLRRLLGQLRFLYFLLRPGGAILTWFAAVISVSRTRFSKLSVVLLTLAIVISSDLSKDEVFRANIMRRLRTGARPGVFFSETSTTMKRMLKRLPTVQRGYNLPWLLRWLGGDITTVSFLLSGYRATDVQYRREHVVARDPEADLERCFTLDWAFPASDKSVSCCCLMLAGIGGDSNSPYIRDVTAKLLDDGLAVAVLLARGLGICTSKSGLDRIYNPTDDGDVHLAVQRLASLYHKVVVVGFSLGGVTTCRYFSSTQEHLIPSNVVGGVGVSGAFKVGFINLPRYQNVYQEVLVPGLVNDICLKYGPELQERLGSIESIWNSTTYEDLHRELFTKANIPNVEADYHKWRQRLEACASKVYRPLLLLTALDDPLHHPEYLGLNKFWSSETDIQNEPKPSDNLMVVVTDSGGHVAWPELGFHNNGYQYLQRVVSEFCQAAIRRSDEE